MAVHSVSFVELLLLETLLLLEKKMLMLSLGYGDTQADFGSTHEDADLSLNAPSWHRSHFELLEMLLLQKKKLLSLFITTRRWWTRPIWINRMQESVFHTVMPLLISGDPEYFRKYYRMTPETFERLHALLEGPRTRVHAVREPLPSRARLAITIRYLASGMYMQDVALEFRVGISTVAGIVHETCRLLWRTLQPICIGFPTTDTWKAIAKRFSEVCDFPNCVGAIDGKHVQIQAPPNSGTLYFNYKGTYSIVLMAVADSDLRFIVVDVGAYGRQTDGGTFSVSRFGKAMEQGNLGLPDPEPLPNTNISAPYVFVADDAFPLRVDLMKPYAGRQLTKEKRIFNYRLSRARRCVENTFGVMASRFRILRRPINLLPENADYVVMACCVLHNFLREDAIYMSQSHDEDVSGQQATSETLFALQPPVGRNYTKSAADTRDLLCDYFISPEGALPWQEKRAGVRT